MPFAPDNYYNFVFDLINKSMLIGNPPRPIASQVMFQRFWFANSNIYTITVNILNKVGYFFENCLFSEARFTKSL